MDLRDEPVNLRFRPLGVELHVLLVELLLHRVTHVTPFKHAPVRGLGAVYF